MFLFFIFMNRCGLGGCSGHSSRKKADVAAGFKALLRARGIRFEHSTESISTRGPPIGQPGLKKGQGITARGSNLWPWLMLLGNIYLGQICGHTSLSSSVPCLCSWPWLLSPWLFSVKMFIQFNKIGFVILSWNMTISVCSSLTRDTSVPQRQCFRVFASHLSSCFSAVPASSLSEGCFQERTLSICATSWWWPRSGELCARKKSWMRILHHSCLRCTWRF